MSEKPVHIGPLELKSQGYVETEVISAATGYTPHHIRNLAKAGMAHKRFRRRYFFKVDQVREYLSLEPVTSPQGPVKKEVDLSDVEDL